MIRGFQYALGLFIMALLTSCAKFDGEEVFTEHIEDPIPASVTILNEFDNGGVRTHLSLHFKISSEDLQRIIDSGSYEEGSALPGSMFDFEVPSWWKPERLGRNRIQLVWEHIPASEHSEWRRYLIHNVDKNEVYFLVVYFW